MKKTLTRISALFLTLCMLLTAVPLSALAAETQPSLTRGAARDLMLAYAGDYNASATAGTVLRGYGDGSTKEDRPVARIEALVMLARAFSPFSAPDAYWSTVSERDVTFTDVPAWAAADVAKLTAAGLLTSSKDGLLRPDETMEQDELDTLLYRIFAMKGENFKDDFYSSIKRKDLNAAKQLPGSKGSGIVFDVGKENKDRIDKLLEKVFAEKNAPGTDGHQLDALYETYLDKETRNKNGAEPISHWLKAIDSAESIADLQTVNASIYKTAGAAPIFSWDIGCDDDDSSKYIIGLAVPKSMWGVAFYENGEPAKQEAYRTFLTGILKLCGYSETQAKTDAAEYYAYEHALSKVELTAEQWYNPSLSYNDFTLAQLSAKLPDVDLNALFTQLGYLPTTKLDVADKGALDIMAETMNNGNLARAKVVSRVDVIIQLSSLLSLDFSELHKTLNEQIYGVANTATDKDRATTMVMKELGDTLGKLYVEQYFSPESKADVEDMCRSILKLYTKRIDRLDWMSAETKKMAKKKLETMKVLVGYPDQWPTTYDKVVLKTPAEGGTFFENICALRKAKTAELRALQGHPVEQGRWFMSAYEVNAYYVPSQNSITFPAGILQAPFYDKNASKEVNLAGIGATIGHEISHAFDNTGAQFDEKGNVANWWTDADYKAFETRCQSAIDFYDGWEACPGVAISGERCLTEDIADIAGVSCALELLEQKVAKPDYKAFFEAYSQQMIVIYPHDTAKQINATDTHAPANLRVNRVLSNFQQFYDAFGITEKDAMYVAPAARIQIW
ncbi:MAG: M13 family metallopeptidase [Oscillospiraceae bacterium]